jgi:hypothetical protein
MVATQPWELSIFTLMAIHTIYIRSDGCYTTMGNSIFAQCTYSKAILSYFQSILAANLHTIPFPFLGWGKDIYKPPPNEPIWSSGHSSLPSTSTTLYSYPLLGTEEAQQCRK